jgi:hypothetical protein
MESYSTKLEFSVSAGVMMMFANEQVISYGYEGTVFPAYST